jgi:plastocyanin
MKKNLQIVIFYFLLIFGSVIKIYAQAGPYADTVYIGWNGTSVANAFFPSNITVAPGDSVLFIVKSSNHPTEQVTAGTWTSNPTLVIPSAAAGYQQAIKVTSSLGNYTYRCQIHGFTGTIHVSNTTGISNYSAAYDLSASPNPFSDQLSLNLNVGNKNLTFLKIYDLIGKEVAYVDLAGKTGSHSYNVDTSNLRAGIYFCTVYSDRGVVETMKLFKTNQ